MRGAALVVVLGIAASPSHADSPGKMPDTRSVRSKSGRYRAVVKLKAGDEALSLYDQRDRAAPRRLYARRTVNDMTPAEVRVSDSGHVVTLDAWGRMGFKHALVVYGPDGRVLVDRHLEELLLATELARKVRSSISNRWWWSPGKGTISFAGDQVVIRSLWGAHLRFNLSDGQRTSGGRLVPIPLAAERFAAYAGGRRRFADVTIALDHPRAGLPRVTSCQLTTEQCITEDEESDLSALHFVDDSMVLVKALRALADLRPRPGKDLDPERGTFGAEVTFLEDGYAYTYMLRVPLARRKRFSALLTTPLR